MPVQAFPEDAFVGETRLEPRDLLADAPLPETYPSEAGPWPAAGEDAEAHVRAAVRAWFPAPALKDIFGTHGIDRVALGRWALRLPVVRALLTLAHAKPRAVDDLIAAVGRELPGFQSAAQAEREGWLASALSLLSYAQRDVAGHALPLVNVQTTLWVREVRRLLARVGGAPAFTFYDEAPPPADEAWLPRYACQDCRVSSAAPPAAAVVGTSAPTGRPEPAGPTQDRPPTAPPPAQAPATELSPAVAPVATVPTAPPASDRPATVSTSPPIAAATRSVLDTPLTDLDLPTRLSNWAGGRGLETLGEIARIAPATLLTERNLGRKSIADARTLIESLLGQTWEAFLANPTNGVDGWHATVDATPPMSLEVAAANRDWDAARAALTDEQRSVPLDDMELSTRIRGYAEREGLRTLGDLAERSRQQLILADNLGRASIGELPQAVAEHFDHIAQELELARLGLVEGFKTILQQLDPMLRIILTRRSGLGGEAQTLQELGETFGVTRERIRQLETKTNTALRRREWAREVRRRVDAAVTQGAVPLDELASDPWWATATAGPDVMRYIIEDILELPAYVVELDEVSWLSRHKRPAIGAAWDAMLAAANYVPLPAPVAAFDALLTPAQEGVGQRLATHLLDQLREHMQIDEPAGAPARVVAIGDTRHAELLAILRSCPEPIHIDELFRRVGRRVHITDDVIYFRRGTVGLKQHFPDFEGWKARLGPRAVRLVETLGPDRQWSCTELLDELREEQEIPDWLTAYGLAALIKQGSGLACLGRLRVALPGKPENEARVFVHDALEQLLREAGAPVARDELVAKIRERLGASDFSIQQVFSRPQFVRVDQDRVGLLERDVPGGAPAITEAVEHVEGLLSRRERGLSSFHVHQEVRLLSAAHADWTEPLTLSLIRSDGRFRLSQSGAVGLATWESTRVPTRLELVRSALADADGRVSIEALMARIEAHYGERPTRATMGAVAMNIGAGLDGGWMVRREATQNQ